MKAPSWQIDRATRFHAAFVDVARAIDCEGANLVAQLKVWSAKLNGITLADGRVLKASDKTLIRCWYEWIEGGRKASALLPKYSAGAATRSMPDELAMEIARLASMPVGGRDKNQNGIEPRQILKQLVRRWHAGESLPGIGTWQEWFSNNNPGLPLPHAPIEFPWSLKTISRKMGPKVVRRIGNIGRAAANGLLPSITRNYAKLRRCEMYMMDDVRLDLVAIDELSGKVVEVKCYILIEVASRSIVSYVLKPEAALKAEDVDEMLACGLQAEGFGIGVDYVTHLWFERGTIACSEAAQRVLEAGSDGQIQIHRTSMDGGIRWEGSAADKASGHAAGKAVIESFNRLLHRYLIDLPGQRGNSFSNQPANLGVGESSVKDPSRSDRQTLKAQAERLAQFKLTALLKGQQADIRLPLLTVTALRNVVSDRISEHNTTGGHGYQGFHTVQEAEVAPGVWQRVS